MVANYSQIMVYLFRNKIIPQPIPYQATVTPYHQQLVQIIISKKHVSCQLLNKHL
jgi:hypothetical protein